MTRLPPWSIAPLRERLCERRIESVIKAMAKDMAAALVAFDALGESMRRAMGSFGLSITGNPKGHRPWKKVWWEL